MKNFFTIIVALVVAAVLGLFMITFQVRFDQVAVLTTFNEANKETSLKTEPGFYLQWPWPVSKAYVYSTRIQLLEGQLNQLQTSDNKSVIPQLYMTWKIKDPYVFYRNLKNVPNAEKQLKDMMKSLNGVISRYSFDQLVNTNTDKIKLVEIEQSCADELRNQLASIDPSYGIEIVHVGMRRLVLPEKTTEKVFERMRSTRQSMAESARSEGTAAALSITSEAEGAQKRTLAFAQRRAQAIRDEGDRDAARYYETFTQDEEFAIMLRHIEALKKTLPQDGTTLILDANKLGVNKLFPDQPTDAK